MPTGKPKCPVCQGTGMLTEDTREYEFITRDPITAKCLLCNGEGWLNPSTKLPNGQRAFEVWRKDGGTTGSAGSGKRLNVSKKAVVNPEAVDTGVGYKADSGDNNGIAGTASCATTKSSASGKRRGRPKKGEGKEPYETPMFLEMVLNPRLNKVLASGKEFLIVTETEPYYLDVYRMIRKQEKKQGTWTQQDEERYVEALEEGYDSLMLDSRLSTPASNKLSAGDPGRWNDKSGTRDKEVANG